MYPQGHPYGQNNQPPYALNGNDQFGQPQGFDPPPGVWQNAPPQSPGVWLKKNTHPPRLQQLVSNFPETQEYLATHEWAAQWLVAGTMLLPAVVLLVLKKRANFPHRLMAGS